MFYFNFDPFMFVYVSAFVKHFGAKSVCFLMCYINKINLKLENNICLVMNLWDIFVIIKQWHYLLNTIFYSMLF